MTMVKSLTFLLIGALMVALAISAAVPKAEIHVENREKRSDQLGTIFKQVQALEPKVIDWAKQAQGFRSNGTSFLSNIVKQIKGIQTAGREEETDIAKQIKGFKEEVTDEKENGKRDN